MNDKDCTKCGAELVWIGSVMGGKMCCPRCTVPSAEAQALANTAVTMPGSATLAEVDFDELLAVKPGPLREAIVRGESFQMLVVDGHGEVKGRRQGQTAARALEELRCRDPRFLINEAQLLLRDMFLMQAPAGTAYKGAADRLVKTLEHLARELHRR